METLRAAARRLRNDGLASICALPDNRARRERISRSSRRVPGAPRAIDRLDRVHRVHRLHRLHRLHRVASVRRDIYARPYDQARMRLAPLHVMKCKL